MGIVEGKWGQGGRRRRRLGWAGAEIQRRMEARTGDMSADQDGGEGWIGRKLDSDPLWFTNRSRPWSWDEEHIVDHNPIEAGEGNE
jgi:hypothetical protein